MKISAWAIRNPVPVLVVSVLSLILGIYSLGELPVKRLPNVDFPLVSVFVSQPGGAPYQVERQVTRPIEDSLAGLAGLRHLESTVTAGGTTTTAEFQIGTDMQKAFDNVRDAVERARPSLPQGVEAPSIRRVDMSAAPILTFAVRSASMDDIQLSEVIDEKVATALQGHSGIAQVSRVGGASREILVALDPARLAASGATVTAVDRALASVNQDGGGGHIVLAGREQSIRISGEVATVDALRQISIPLPDGQSIMLGEIATLTEGAGERRSYARLNGRAAVGFQVSKTDDASEVEVAEAVADGIKRVQKQYPSLVITEVASTVNDTRASYEATRQVLLEGMALTSLVVFAFLRSWRSTLIAAVAMPLSLVPTFTFMHAFGFSLNIITLLALTLVIGILVDDAIVEIENIEKRIAGGETPYKAAMIGADAIGLAVVATTAAIVAIFIPVSFMGGQAGQFFQEFGLTVAAAVIFSLLVARFVIPILAAYILKPIGNYDSYAGKQPHYLHVLGWSLRHPWLTVGISTAVFVGGIALALTLPLGFQPVGDPGYVNINVAGPLGATKEEMERPLASIERYLLKREDVLAVFTQFGSTSAGRDSLPGSSTATDLATGSVTVVLRADRKISTNAFQSSIQKALRSIPDARLTIEGSATNTGVEVVLAGTDIAALGRAQRQLVREMRTLSSIRNPLPLPPPSSPELVVVPRTEIASQLGVTAEDIARTVRIATIGEADSLVAKLTMGEHRVAIRTKMAGTAFDTLQNVGELRLPLSNGGSTSLSAVADYYYSDGPGRIIRYDRERRVSVKAELSDAPLGQALQDIGALDVMRNLPSGVHVVQAGDSESMSELISGFLFAIIFGIILVYSVLVLLFQGGLKPVVILCAIPLSMIGAFVGLKMFSVPITLPVFIGILMLFGLATKNSILLVELAASLEREGKSRRDALLSASSERARPIIMTTFAMIAGMIPTALGVGEGSAFRQPMALAVIGGLISSTALSLLLVPALYEAAELSMARIKRLQPFARTQGPPLGV